MNVRLNMFELWERYMPNACGKIKPIKPGEINRDRSKLNEIVPFKTKGQFDDEVCKDMMGETLFQYARFIGTGRKVFEVSTDLADLLALTDINEWLLNSPAKLPFDSMIIFVPGDSCIRKSILNHYNSCPDFGEYKSLGYDEHLRETAKRAVKIHSGGDISLCLEISRANNMVYGYTLSVYGSNTDRLHKLGMNYKKNKFHIVGDIIPAEVFREKTFKEPVHEDNFLFSDLLKELAPEKGKNLDPGFVDQTFDQGVYKSSRHLILNLMMYLKSDKYDYLEVSKWKDEIKPEYSNQKQEDIKRGGNRPRVILGGSIIIDPIFKQSIHSSGQSGPKIKTKFTVRGHFRRQKCGKDRIDTKTIWIKPFWKGQDFAQSVHKKYEVR